MLDKNVRATLLALALMLPLASPATQLIPVEDFARRPTLLDPTLSPDGKYISVRLDDESGDTHSLVVLHVEDMSKAVSMLRMPRYELPLGVTWVSTNRLVVEKGKQIGRIDKPYYTGEIIATNVDGTHQDYLFGTEPNGKRSGTRSTDIGWGFVDGLPQVSNGHFYMSAHIYGREDLSQVYDVDAVSSVRHLMGDIQVGGMRFLVDNKGAARVAHGTNEDNKDVLYVGTGSSWAELKSADFSPMAFNADDSRIYAVASPDGRPAQLVEQDLQGGNRKLLAKDAFGSILNMQWTAAPRVPFAASTDTGIPTWTYVDKNLPASKLHQALSAKFPGQIVNFINFSEDGGQLLFSVSSDRDPGLYLLIDTKTFKVSKLFAAEDWIDPAKMAERRPVRFKASDGLELEGYLTIPPGRAAGDMPLVLLPHGGPHDIRDDWYYDTDAQFLASRGYLVLQVNYRGSSGRGKAFALAGRLKWGTRIQQDLIDGVKWTIEQKLADPKRICIYGASFGGYSAMMAPIRAPGLFKCAVGYAGVYDLAMMYDKGDVHQNKSGRSYLRDVIGRDDAELAANSPDKHADQIDVPVLLVHGEDDQRAPFAQAKAMRAALDAAHKPNEWWSVSGEGHGFYKTSNQVEFYKRLQAFLEKNIGPGAPLL